MLTVRLIGFLSDFRKHYLGRQAGVGQPLWSSGSRLLFALPLLLPLLLPSPAARAASAEEDEPGRPYIRRDAEGNRVFGTDDKSEAGFSSDPQTGDRTFRTAPPKKQDDAWEGPRNIFVTPEITPAGGPARRSPRRSSMALPASTR